MKVFLVAVLLIACATCMEADKDGNPIDESHYDEHGEHDDDYDHEAVLGSAEEAEEFAHLSPEEAKEKLGDIFEKMDTNNDDLIEQPELVQWILQSFAKLNKADTKSKMEQDDKDKDGFVTWVEFVESTYGMSEQELKASFDSDHEDPATKKTTALNFEYDRKKFDAADENGDGKLDLDEATAFLHPYDYERMAGVETERVLAEYDTNKDGKITAEEYLSHSTFAGKSKEDAISEKENFLFNDNDKDGALDKKEILKWVSPNLDSAAREEAAHLMQETDKDKDGHLTLEEVQNEHELWVGSEATNYGDQLHDEL